VFAVRTYVSIVSTARPLTPAADFSGNKMQLYNSIGPNPKVVRMFMAEKGIELPPIEVDIRGGANRREPYLEKNPGGQCLSG
jgi:hypothetical protein